MTLRPGHGRGIFYSWGMQMTGQLAQTGVQLRGKLGPGCRGQGKMLLQIQQIR
jgi:hypothetical protein